MSRPGRQLTEALYQLRRTLETREQREALRAVERLLYSERDGVKAIVRLPVSLTYQPTPAEAEAVRWALMRAHGRPEGIPVGEEVPDAIRAAQERAGHGETSRTVQAVLVVEADGTTRIETG